MKLLERSFTTRTRRERDERTLDDPSGVDDDAMSTSRKTQGKRPNTSAGVGEGRQRSMSKGWRRSKDGVKSPTCSEDLHKAGRVVEITDGMDTFRFPTPSPRMPPRSATFQHSPSPLQYESPRIGVAIGSPSHAPPNWGRSYTADNLATIARQPPTRSPPRPPLQTAVTEPAQERRKKKTSWKPFGSLFRKSSKHVAAEALAEEKPNNAPTVQCSPDLLLLGTSSGFTTPNMPSPRPVSRTRHTRTPSWSRQHRRPESRGQEERTSHLPNKLVRGMSLPSPRIKPLRESVDIFKQVVRDRRDSPMEQENINIELIQIPTPRTPKLMLEFPKPEFERYSVMFEKLLNNDSRPSLLERRQSKLQRKKSTREQSGERLGVRTVDFAGIPQRSLTSPHLTSRLSIRVDSTRDAPLSADIRRSPAERSPKPLQRSNTAPPDATSPFKTMFNRDRKETLQSSPESPHSIVYSENSLPPTPTTVTTCTDTESIRKVLEQNEPAWEMMTSRKLSTIVSPTVDTGELYPRVKSPEDLERQIVQVSVARQVSVSRARNRVQKAMETKQPLRPRVVELTKNRKSTVGVLESAGDEEVEPLPERPSVDAAQGAVHEAGKDA